MKKQFLIGILILALMLALLLCGCTAAALDAAPEGVEPGVPAESNQAVGDPAQSGVPAGDAPTEPGFPVQSAPDQSALPGSDPPVSGGPSSAAQVGKEVDRTDYGVGDGPHEAEETQYGRTLSREESQALWARLEGKWILSDAEEWKQSDGLAYLVYDFSAMEYGGCRLWEYSAWGSSVYEWDWTVVREQDGIYTVRVSSESGEMMLFDCHQNSGTLFTLQFTEEGILLARSRPTRFEWWETEPTEYNQAIMVTRLATEAEQALLASEGDEYGQVRFEDGSAIISGCEWPAREYRLVTDEELEQLMQGTGE